MAVWSREKYIGKPTCMAISLGSLQYSYRRIDGKHNDVNRPSAAITDQPCNSCTSGLNTL